MTIVAPWTASWTAEEQFTIERCRWAGGAWAVCQLDARGQGKPLFAKPHAVRQRQAIVAGLCDLCGLRLGPVKVCLSFGRDADVGEVCVEPLSHPHCAVIATTHCPHLERHVAAGTVRVREVHRYDIALARLRGSAVLEFTGQRHWRDGLVIGHAKLLIRRAFDRDTAWLNNVGGGA